MKGKGLTAIAGLVVAGLSGDSGKTIVTSCLLTALRQKQRTISAFKKGPDYIDAAWLTHLGQAVCRNLDTYLVAPEDVRESFVTHSLNSDIAVIEGNRGLFDGKDADGTHSTAELAKLLDAPVLLVVDCTKATRSGERTSPRFIRRGSPGRHRCRWRATGGDGHEPQAQA